MRRTVTLASLAAVMALLALGVTLVAQDNTGASATTGAGTSYSTPSSTSGATGSACDRWKTMSDQQMMGEDQKAMKSMGMSEDMMLRRKMLMGMQVNADDPGAILALKSDLNLSQDQIDKIQRINDKARNDVKAVLNDSQKQKIATLERTPESMVAMCRHLAQEGMTTGAVPPGSYPATTGTYGTPSTTAGATGMYGTPSTTSGATGMYGTPSTTSGTTGSGAATPGGTSASSTNY